MTKQTINNSQVRALMAKLEDKGMRNPDVRLDYSGRGMYGQKCFAVVVKPSNLVRVVVALAYVLAADEQYSVDGLDLEDKVDDLSDYQTDSMGFEMVVYWPNLQHEDVETE